MAGNFLRHGSNSALIVAAALIFAAALAGLITLSPLWILAGALLFHLTEYGTHRYLFHARPSRFGWLLRMQHRLHYDHHTDPRRLELLFLPLWYVVPNLAATVVLMRFILGSWQLAILVALGAGLALLHYEWVHFAAHTPYRPRTGFGRWMKKYHMWHHFRNERLWFGVSNPLLDFAAGTYRYPDQAGRSATTRTLHGGS